MNFRASSLNKIDLEIAFVGGASVNRTPLKMIIFLGRFCNTQRLKGLALDKFGE
jgi:hypothetical protein